MFDDTTQSRLIMNVLQAAEAAPLFAAELEQREARRTTLIEWVQFPALGDHRGSLVALEANQSVPFAIERVYYLFATKEGVSRGFHAHVNLQQVAICVTGSCTMILDDGDQREEVRLDSPVQGVVLQKMVWHEMHDFSPDCVLLVLASEHYDEADYIRNYQDFLTIRAHMQSESYGDDL